MKNKRIVESNIKRWLEILVRTESKVSNGKYYLQGVYYGLFIGLIANIWSSLFYQDFLITLPYHWRITIFSLLSLIGVCSAIILIYQWNNLSIASRVLKVSIPKLYDNLLEINNIKPKGMSLQLDDKTIGNIFGKNWKNQRWYKKQKEEMKRIVKTKNHLKTIHYGLC